MKATFENHCLFVLASCLVAALGLLALNQQCSLSAITLAVAGVAGIVSGMPGVIASFGQRWAEKGASDFLVDGEVESWRPDSSSFGFSCGQRFSWRSRINQ